MKIHGVWKASMGGFLSEKFVAGGATKLLPKCFLDNAKNAQEVLHFKPILKEPSTVV